MLAALLTNLSGPPDHIPPEAIKRWQDQQKRVFKLAEEALRRKRQDETKLRDHLEDAIKRLRKNPESAKKLSQIIAIEEPNLKVVAQNEVIVELIQMLYLQYLDDEEVVLLAVSVI